ncbi:malonyl-ACP O-methyltransferase BioC [Shewanella xiamenensis]|uniref:malonyl-[acyl-carrier protein] O-methyltransferase n=1 Tax=Shewanella xiamenensis TaxID=332186 RepID=A0AAE4PYC5_9GAMM|nr:malonyl-ACP O-methyltransferase BioC [Shewanella xiamenensis]MDV5390546.1 malonyl-ACP O-methyltransferase BioC [Shewanella xiamenensis]BDQ65873.1 malonyl-[acyl-carrier protein] O-methyltransferase [Shewanella xiamenensis]GLD76002.1 malonyl-[acyl-carrier protein] O-methyltransferase [Shewanella xiamenensis]
MSMPLGVSLNLHEPADQLSHIAERFSAAAKSYQEHNCLQRLSGASLLQGFVAKGAILDIGAGPGTDFANRAMGEEMRVYALDIALGMLQQLQATFPRYLCVCGNAEQLPFADACIDNIYSNLALQWCHDFSAATSEMARVLTSGGEAHLSIVAAGSLEQLSNLGLRVNSFLSLESLQAAFDDTDWQFLDVKLMPMTVYFQDLKALLYSIKGVGASVQSSVQTVTSSESDAHFGKLRGRHDWQALQQRAEQFREAQGLPLTYQIAQFRVRRQGGSV